MSATTEQAAPPEDNVTGQDYADRSHFRYNGPPIFDVHAHVMQTRPTDPKSGPPVGSGPGATTTQAEAMIAVAVIATVGARAQCRGKRLIPQVSWRLSEQRP